MFRSYLTIMLRHATRHKLFSFVNVLCLAIGITFTMIIGIYVLNQKRVNADLKNLDDQYVIKSEWGQENMGPDITTLGPLAKTMKDEYPNLVENYYRFDPVVNIVSVGNKHFRTQISVGDTTLVSMYGFRLLYGNPRQAFRDNQSAVVTEDFALKFFSKRDIVSKVITIQTPADGQKHDFIITAVLKNPSYNTVTNYTNTRYEVFLPMDANQYFQGGDRGDNWANVFMVSMLQLRKGANPKDLQKPFEQTLEKYQPPFVQGNLKVALAPVKTYFLKDNHGAISKMITILSLIAVFILVMAIINFVNINIGTSAYRLKEIGMRRIFGGNRSQLIAQFIMETLLLTFLATIISALFYELLRPLFNDLLNTSLTSFLHFNFSQFLFLFVLTLLVGVIAGIYPAFVLSSTAIANSAKGKWDEVKGGLMVRRTLLIIQFTLGIFVFISALNVGRQISYVFHKDLGYSKDQVMIISSLPRQWDSLGVIRMESRKSELLQISGVGGASLSYDIPDGNGGGNVNVYAENGGNFVSMLFFAVDKDFEKVYNLHMKEGTFLGENGNYQSGNVVLNEKAVAALGLDSPIGKTVRLGAPDGLKLTVTGVVKDFHFESMQHAVQPLLLAYLNEPFSRSYRYMSVKINTSDIVGAVNTIQGKWKSLFPDAGFEYSFMDDRIQSLYKSEMQLKKATDIATVLNLIIVFLGIFGVVAFTLVKRSKEIAVRKVLGADTRNIILLFIKEYAWLIIIANAIGCPIAYLAINGWLQNYAYRMHLTPVPYLVACTLVVLGAFGLIAAQCFNVASSNPVKSLRME